MHFTMNCTAEPFCTLGLLSITEPQMISNFQFFCLAQHEVWSMIDFGLYIKA